MYKPWVWAIILIILIVFVCTIYLRYQYVTQGNFLVQFQDGPKIFPTLKTGDLILTRATNASFLRQAVSGPFFTHIEMVYRCPKSGNLFSMGVPSNILALDRSFLRRPLYPEWQRAQNKQFPYAIRRLNRPLSSEQILLFEELIRKYEDFFLPRRLKTQRTKTFMKLLGKQFIRILFKQSDLFLYDDNIPPNVCCTDVVAWLLYKLGLIRKQSDGVIPAFYTKEDINNASNNNTLEPLYSPVLEFCTSKSFPVANYCFRGLGSFALIHQ